MAGIAKSGSDQPVLEPSKLQEDGLEGVPEDWQHAVHTYQPCEGLYINCISGRPGGTWSFQAEGPAAFSINILLEGRIQTAFDDGAVVNVSAGSTILMASGEPASGWDVLDGQTDGAFRLVSIHLPQEAMANLTGLHMDELRRRARALPGDQSHIDAFLGVVPSSSTMQRVACDLLGFGRSYAAPCLSRDLYLRAKAMEGIACFMQENLELADMPLPVPADRQRLIEARALLEKNYGQEWTVQSLARAVGLNEKRLQQGFQALYGYPVHACLTRIRLNAAVALLKRGVSVTETAACCGFANLSHFSRMFHGHTGITPKQCALGISPRIAQQDTSMPLL
ncbi:helix-turn-helix transcriptional regulator [Azorhizophilus paspali]|uniref:Helix-turn-helix transcriptional regulator n=1 Tax=Azorhizophilus paspali TaxID=69963 RepID=A0ABV6SFH1_AZOPA